MATAFEVEEREAIADEAGAAEEAGCDDFDEPGAAEEDPRVQCIKTKTNPPEGGQNGA